NIPRILGEGMGFEVKEGTWEILPVFGLLERYGKIPHREMFNIFNMGVGMVIAVAPEDVDKTLEILNNAGERATVIGKVIKGDNVIKML
ncbi:MAG: phosphoribosylformylglycinamidine cyclo-ligase, partial [Muribaculaceae bacterium]|nr:phosphoribosylformylglycinamidine cyclo-ligase [Muribaculaceae bacterium]